jgi:hypothetical protein
MIYYGIIFNKLCNLALLNKYRIIPESKVVMGIELYVYYEKRIELIDVKKKLGK